jgi:hypothetical protein
MDLDSDYYLSNDINGLGRFKVTSMMFVGGDSDH